MAKDDYNYIVFKVLAYLYTCLKRQNSFDEIVFKKKIITEDVPEEYFVDVLRLMQDEQLIEGITLVKAWGNNCIMANDLSKLVITSNGVRYLLDNDKMNKIKDIVLSGTPGLIFDLVKIAF